MRRGGILAGLGAMALTLTACPSGWRLQAINGAEPTITAVTWRRIDCTTQALQKAGPMWKAAIQPHLHCKWAQDEEQRLICTTAPNDRKKSVVVSKSEDLSSLLTFVHLSDVQLKEHQIQLEGPLGDEAQYDGIQSGSNRDDLLEQNDDASFQATVLAINELAELPAEPTVVAGRFAGLPSPGRPSFVIHTGDAVDAGMFSELFQFVGIMDQLNIRYFNVVGNHDNLYFGTLPAETMSGVNVALPYVPIVTTERFMRYHSRRSAPHDPSLPFPPDSVASDDHQESKCGLGADVETTPCTDYHGFDLSCPDHELQRPRGITPGLCDEARGYYAFDITLNQSPSKLPWKVRAIVLNTAQVVPETVSTAFERRSRGHMLPEQLAWLKRELATEDALFLVFGHHNLEAFLHDDQAEALKKLLFEEERVLAYIAGHTHVDGIVRWDRSNEEPFWEIVGGSTLVYPQLARLIELIEDPAGAQLLLRVLSFRQRLGDHAAALRRASGSPSSCEAPSNCWDFETDDTTLCQRLADRSHEARAGAARDHDGDRRDEGVAVSRINGLLPVFNLRGAKKP